MPTDHAQKASKSKGRKSKMFGFGLSFVKIILGAEIALMAAGYAGYYAINKSQGKTIHTRHKIDEFRRSATISQSVSCLGLLLK